MTSTLAAGEDDWLGRWLDAVRDGTVTMSQRSRAAVVARVGIEAAVAAAQARGVHLVALMDDKGRELIAASRHAFTALCLVSSAVVALVQADLSGRLPPAAIPNATR